eukprot:jgi/Botrbrau1/18963/Bobra.0798s0002.1
MFREGGLGTEGVPSVVGVVAAAARNPVAEGSSVEAVFLLKSIARRLTSASAERSISGTDREATSPLPGATSALPGATSALPGATSGLSAAGSGLSAAASAEQSPWVLVLGTLSVVARHDPRAAVADTAANVVLEVLESYCQKWDSATWAAIQAPVIGYLFDLPAIVDADGQPKPADTGRPVGWSTEGLARVLRFTAKHLPTVFSLLRDNLQVAAPHLLRPLLGMLVRYIVQTHEVVAELGIGLLQTLVLQLAPVLDTAGWEAVLQNLSIASSADTMSGIINPSSIRAPGGDGSEPPTPMGSSIPLKASGEAEAARVRCRVTVLMQRSLDLLHSSTTASMPSHFQLQLLSILQDSVQRAAAFNRSAQRRHAALMLLEPAEGDFGAHQPSSPMAAATNWQSPSEDGTGEEAAPTSGAASRRQSVEDYPAGWVRPTPLWDESLVVPALMRQEAEGGALLIAALLRCMREGTGEGGLAGETEARLLNVCRQLLIDASRDAWQQHKVSLGSRAGDASQALPSEGCPWEQAVRAPLVTAVLGGYQMVGPTAWRQELREIFPHLARLICSSQPSVRSALAQLLQAQLPPLIAEL